VNLLTASGYDVSGAELTSWCFALMLVVARVGAAMAFLPGLGEPAIPAPVRAGLALSIALLLLPDIKPLTPDLGETGLAVGAAVAAEVVTGSWFGWITRLWMQTLSGAGQFMAYLFGLSSVLQPDPELGPQTTALARLFGIGAPLLVLVSGLYSFPIRGLDSFYRIVPPGSLAPSGPIAERSVQVTAQVFALSLQLASPFIVASIVWHVAIGLMSRLVPRMQLYFISLPGQILGGTLLLAVTLSALLMAWMASLQAGLSSIFGGS
jgi:flagellar biosynthesis protein FliR